MKNKTEKLAKHNNYALVLLEQDLCFVRTGPFLAFQGP